MYHYETNLFVCLFMLVLRYYGAKQGYATKNNSQLRRKTHMFLLDH